MKKNIKSLLYCAAAFVMVAGAAACSSSTSENAIADSTSGQDTDIQVVEQKAMEDSIVCADIPEKPKVAGTEEAAKIQNFIDDTHAKLQKAQQSANAAQAELDKLKKNARDLEKRGNGNEQPDTAADRCR